jgi:RNA polymerase sigma-70 factor (ECF subfamily)
VEVSEHLFRHEWGRLVAALTRIFGAHNLALAEDVAQEAFCRAVEIWGYRGPPPNPQAWLMKTAKNCALDALRRERTARRFGSELHRYMLSEWTMTPMLETLFASEAIKDDVLRMMFSCCAPELPEESQLALILNILCGFSVDEIAAAFLGGHAGAEKRIARAKRTLSDAGELFTVESQSQFAERLPTVLRALYLLFNEGYHGASKKSVIRTELCQEAMRLAALLLDHPAGATPDTYALSALMCLNAARLPGRIDALGELQTLADQDRSSWDRALIAEGLALLGRSASGTGVSPYHIEGSIAACHSTAAELAGTDWRKVVHLYDALGRIAPSPVVELNRAIAIAQVEGAERGLSEIAAIAERERLAAYPFYHAAMGELEFRCERYLEARQHFRAAVGVARNPAERGFLERRERACGGIAPRPFDVSAP